MSSLYYFLIGLITSIFWVIHNKWSRQFATLTDIEARNGKLSSFIIFLFFNILAWPILSSITFICVILSNKAISRYKHNLLKLLFPR